MMTFRFACLLASVCLIGCVSVPNQESAVNQLADRLTQAEAEMWSTHAPLEVRSAKERLAAARLANAEGQSDQARLMVAEAHINLDLAEEKITSAEVRQMLSDHRQRVETLRQELEEEL